MKPAQCGTWILLRGLMREQRHWGAFPALLAQALPGAVIITPDLPGNGARCHEASPMNVAGMVEECRAELLQCRISAPVNVLALSLGAMVAVEWRARYPGELARCVLLNTSLRPYSAFYERLRWGNYPAILGQLARGGVAGQEALILRLTSNVHAGDAAVLAAWIAYQHEFPVTRRNVLRQLLAAARYHAPREVPGRCPVLVLNGQGDQLVDPQCSERLAQAWQAPLRQHATAGHDLPLDAGVWVVEQVQAWMDEKKPRTNRGS